MPTGLKSNEKLATFNCPRDRWEQFKQKVGKGNAAKTLNAMISAYLAGAINVSNWTAAEPIDGAAHEWFRELESQLEFKLKTMIASLTTELVTEQKLRFAEIAKQQVLASQKCEDAMREIGKLTVAIAEIKKNISRNKWMVDKYADVLVEIEDLQGAVATLQEETAAYMKRF